MASKQGFTLGDLAKQYEAKVSSATAIVDKLTTLRGTMSEWRKQGTAAAEATDLSAWIADEGFEVTFVLEPTTTIGEHLTDVRNYLTEVEQFGNEVMTAWIQEHAPKDAETAGLREQLSAITVEAEQLLGTMHQLAEAFGQDMPENLSELPVAPKGRSGGASHSGKTSNVHFFRTMKNGELQDMPNSQNMLSSVSWFGYGHMPVEDLREAMVAQYPDAFPGAGSAEDRVKRVEGFKDWSGVVTATFKDTTYSPTIGWRVDPATPEADATDEEETEEESPAEPEADAS